MEKLKEIFARFDAEIVVPVVDILMEKYYQYPPAKSLIPDPFWKEHTRQELIDLVGQKKIRERIQRGFELLSDQINKLLSEVELEQIKEELSKGFAELTKERGKILEKKTAFATQTLPLSDETMDKFYQCGLKFFEAEHLEEAADLFFVLNLFDFRRHNIWMALGLCEQKLEHWDPALSAFSMAIITNPHTPVPYVHSADCYYALGMTQDVIECLDAAIAAISTYGDESRLREHITELRNKVRH